MTRKFIACFLCLLFGIAILFPGYSPMGKRGLPKDEKLLQIDIESPNPSFETIFKMCLATGISNTGGLAEERSGTSEEKADHHEDEICGFLIPVFFLSQQLSFNTIVFHEWECPHSYCGEDIISPPPNFI